MSNQCKYIPDAPNGKPSKLFTEIMARTKNREMAKRIWAFTKLKLFQEEFGDIDVDENGEPTYGAVNEILNLDKIISKSTKERSLAINMGLMRSNGNPKKFDLAGTAQDLADRFNEKTEELVCVVNRNEDGTYSTVIADRTAINLANADENRKRAELNKALIKLIRRVGFDVEFVNDPGYNGVFDPLLARENADLLKKVIRVANNEEGLDALPEEVAHLILAGLKGTQIKERLDKAFTDDVVARILGKQYKDYYKKYKKGKTPVRERLRDEAQGKVLAALFKGERPGFEQEVLTITSNEYTDEFRRVQEESRSLLPEQVSQYHKGILSEERRDNLKRRLGAVYERLLSRRTSVGVGSRRLISEKNGTSFNIIQVNGSLFHDIFEINRNYLENGELVDLHETYDDCKCFLSDDGLCGFAIEPDGNLVSVFSLNPSNKRGFLYAISDFIREQGATHLDAFASENQDLSKIYAKTLGFQVVGRMAYDMEYDRDDIAANHGNPDVVFMSASKRDINERRFNDYSKGQDYTRRASGDYVMPRWLENATNILKRIIAHAKALFGKISEADVDAAISNVQNAFHPVMDLIRSGELSTVLSKENIMAHEALYDLNAKTEKLLEKAQQGEVLLDKKLFILEHTRTKTEEEARKLRGAIMTARKELEAGKYPNAIATTLAMIGDDMARLTKEINKMGFIYGNTTDLNTISSEAALIKRLTTSIQAYKAYLIDISRLPYYKEQGEIEIADDWAESLSKQADKYGKQVSNFERDLGDMRFQVLKQLISLYYGNRGEKPLDFKESEDAKWESIDMFLRQAKQDISIWDANLFSAGDSRNPILNVLHRIIVEQQGKRNLRINKLCAKMQEAYVRLRAAGHDDKYVYQFDEEGKPTGYYVGEVDMAAYERERLELKERLDKNEDLDFYEKKRAIEQWENGYKKDGKTIPGHLTQVEIEMEDGSKFIEYMPNPVYYAVEDFQAGWDQAQKDYYKILIDMKTEMDSYLPPAMRSMLTAPQVRKSITQMFDKDGRGALGTLMSKWERDFKITPDNTDYSNMASEIANNRKYVVTDFANQPIKRVPVYFTHMLEDRRDLSTDATRAMFNYITMAVNYNEMSQLADALELMQQHVNSDSFEVVRTDAGKTVWDVFPALGRIFGRESTITGRGSNVSKAITDYIDRQVFNETRKPIGNVNIFGKEISIDMLHNIFMRLTSISRMGLNPLSGITNATQGETMILSEAFARRYFGLGDVGWSLKEYYSLVIPYLGSFNAIDRHDRLYLLINQFNADEDFFRDMRDRDFNPSPLKRVLGKGNIHFLNTIGEHELHARGMLMVLHFEKVRRLSEPDKKVSLYDVIKSVHDENGWHLELDDDIEFVNKDRAFLQTFGFTDKAIVKRTDRDQLFNNLSLYINKINDDMHGGYSEAEKGNYNQSALWRLILQFRQWMFGMYNKLYSRSYYDAVMNVQREGGYITIYKFLSALWHDAKNTTIKESWNSNQLSDKDKENVRVALAQAGIFGLLCLMVMMTAGWKDEDDRNLRLMAYSIKRLRLETGALVPSPTFADNIFTLIQSPAAGIDTLKTFSDLLDITNYWDTVSSGRFKGWPRALKAAWTLTPIYNVQKLIDMKDYNYMFNIFN